MKVYVTQGHEKGIGLEVFFKSVLFLNQQSLENIYFIGFKNSVVQTLDSLNIPYEIQDTKIVFANQVIHAIWPDYLNFSQSFTALEIGMKLAGSAGILYTLPTSKDQFPGFAGHTEYFRHYFQKPELGMFFSAKNMQILLVTDHIAINQLSTEITEERLHRSLLNAVKVLSDWNWPVSRYLIAGLNPHAGENGLIGNEDCRISKTVKRLRDKFKIEITGPYPGDTMYRERTNEDDLLIYLFHDQGLALFKGLQGLIGSNITLGLPFPRFSPDHGTSFGLFGKNIADYRGCQYSLNQALFQLTRMHHGKNSGHKSKST
jgi:4-hydroxythreonine-4-phosphate dehydrogenase